MTVKNSHWNEGYTLIPNELFCDNNLKPNHKIIMSIIISFNYNADKQLSHSYLGKIANIHKDTVSKITKQLIDWGYIKIIKKGNINKEGTIYKALKYVKVTKKPKKNNNNPNKHLSEKTAQSLPEKNTQSDSLPENFGYTSGNFQVVTTRKNQPNIINNKKNKINKPCGELFFDGKQRQKQEKGAIPELSHPIQLKFLLATIYKSSQREWIKGKSVGGVKSILLSCLNNIPEGHNQGCKLFEFLNGQIYHPTVSNELEAKINENKPISEMKPLASFLNGI